MELKTFRNVRSVIFVETAKNSNDNCVAIKALSISLFSPHWTTKSWPFCDVFHGTNHHDVKNLSFPETQ